jgi:hypothetical protein
LPPYKAAPSQPPSTADPSTIDRLVHGTALSSTPPSHLPWLFSGLSLIFQVSCLSIKKKKKKKKKKPLIFFYSCCVMSVQKKEKKKMKKNEKTRRQKKKQRREEEE